VSVSVTECVSCLTEELAGIDDVAVTLVVFQQTTPHWVT